MPLIADVPHEATPGQMVAGWVAVIAATALAALYHRAVVVHCERQRAAARRRARMAHASRPRRVYPSLSDPPPSSHVHVVRPPYDRDAERPIDVEVDELLARWHTYTTSATR